LSIDGTTFDSPVENPRSDEPRAYVTVVSGPADPPFAELPRGAEVSIGRSRSSGVRVDDGAVSRTHATLRWDGGGMVTLVDYGSRNGTLVDGQRVRGTQKVGSGAEIQVGEARLVVVVGGTAFSTQSVEVDGETGDSGLIAHDPAMLRVLALADRAAATESTILIFGETGVGKEVVAKRIHAMSGRASRPFVAINCGAIAEGVAESTLFGHEKGAFTGANERRVGLFEKAEGGTLFLDEVGELSPAMQARLLRALEARVITPVGATQEVPVDVRVIAATNKDLEEAVTAGTFREDLRYRLDVVRIIVPPLRERGEDVIPLAERFLKGFSPPKPMRLAPDAVAALRSHHWPGNVRELRNVMERIVATCSGQELVRATDMGDLSTIPGEAQGPGLDRKVDDAERQAILEALATCGGNRTHAAKRLGISRRALLYRMEKLGLKAPPPSRRS
jgi:transcriptional regulator with PAS, ATPase and Fis domain